MVGSTYTLDVIGVKLCQFYVVITPNWTHMFVWCMIRVVDLNGHQNVLQSDWITCYKYKHYSRFDP